MKLAALVLATLIVTSGAAAQGAPDVDVYAGLGTWVDIYDHSPWTAPVATASAIQARGVRTLYVQTGNYRQSVDVVRAPALGRLVDAAHARGLAAVGWYLPSLVRPERDPRPPRAALRFPTQTRGP